MSQHGKEAKNRGSNHSTDWTYFMDYNFYCMYTGNVWYILPARLIVPSFCGKVTLCERKSFYPHITIQRGPQDQKIPRALCHHRSWSDKLSSERRLVCVKVTLPVLILQVCQVLTQPLNPNWETVWDTQPHSASPQYNLPVNSLPQKRTDDLSVGCYNKSTLDTFIPGMQPVTKLYGY